MFQRITQSPALVRVVPFVVFVALTFLQDRFGETGRYWIYFGKTLAGAGMLFAVWRHVTELKWRFSIPAVLVGVGVFALWVGLDGFYPATDEIYPRYICPLLAKIGLTKECVPAPAHPPWNPHAAFGAGSTLAILFIVVRIVGSSLVVPPLEEMFWRSFVYRYLVRREFDRETLGKFFPLSFLLTSVFFGFAHREWLAGILCGFAYLGLVVWKNRLGDAMTAHAITNFLLGLWIVWKQQWHFW
ncbi:MAG TPA: CAAX prenyl protease-related protein [Candidatus Acidoferrum sp.]|nr:CAAX prenyl protease-related protein [Candidatus Acidoferrum sp.]